MSSDLHGFTRRKIAAILEKYRVEDDALEQELQEACFEVRAWQPAGPAAPADPRILLVERISGSRVPEIIRARVLESIGDSAEPALRKAFEDWRMKGRDVKDWTWIKWAKTAYRAQGQSQPVQQEPAGFQGLKEWAARHATD